MATVLIVDDDASILDLLDFSLSLDGFDVLRASDGAEGLTIARTHRPDAIVLDVMMPVLDGLATAREIRGDEDLATTPIILLTARTGDAAEWEGWTSGVDSYIAKPLDVDMLSSELRRLGVDADVPASVV